MSLSGSALAADATFLGQDSCSSSGCHGGAGANQNQNIVWARQDSHSRTAATLTTARSGTLARVLGIKDAAQDRRCTSCHAPWQGVSSRLIPTHLNASAEAVSCETCHGPASEWIRSHTRPDLDRSQKALDGLRDLRNLYNRANACVACHQVIEPELLEAGHPELLFELDGQAAGMPRHWRERDPDIHAKAWMVGQATALRELTAQLLRQKTSGNISPRTFEHWQALLWTVSKFPAGDRKQISTNAAASTNSLRELHQLTDQLAMEISSASLGSNVLSSTFGALVKSDQFADSGATPRHLALRAERLVLALDRLLLAAPPGKRSSLDDELNLLFRLVQNRPAFDPAAFRQQLGSFESQLGVRP